MSLAYPDEGAWKRFGRMLHAEGYPEVVCTKVRQVRCGGPRVSGVVGFYNLRVLGVEPHCLRAGFGFLRCRVVGLARAR